MNEQLSFSLIMGSKH